MTNKEIGLRKIQDLVTRFNEQLPAYKKTDYNETQTRRDFIDPFFKALGWDIDNEQGFAESYREVIHEDRVKVGKATKAPDYSFRIGGIRKFFVEAKKPSVIIKDDIQPAYQVRRYGWSAKLNVSIITDFEEFAIYDCNKKPNPTDKTSTSRIKYLTFNEYEKEWDFLWNTFSKEAVNKGFFDTFVKGTANKKGTDTVDKEFLKSLDDWRTLLAETISKENKELDEDELNFVVQQTLDRIIFIRICEDRSIEPYGSLQNSIKIGDYYKNLMQLFKQADEKYNSGLFNFKKDTISHKVLINNKTLKTIITQLYYPESPYEFSVLSVEILGSAYEQFLGKTITINNRGKAVIELKPEVRKAGGVYYTPQYIVDYIVANTIGKQLENKTPKEAAEIKICDPACGSGSFLLGAYQYLLNWHKDYYIQNQNKKNPLTPEGSLTTGEKKKILLNNIYGVDIDTNAVEVTKLSLLLKCMEGETQASIAHQMTMFNERVLPTLENNIKSGNSLIDMDYYDYQLDFGEERKIKPFSWQKGFPDVFKNGGFDAVIGNPPYVLGRETFDNTIKNYISKNFHTYGGKFDLYIFFCEQGLKLLKNNGIFSFIIPNTILANDNSLKLRELILTKYCLNTIRVFDNKVFENANVETVVLNVSKELVNENSNITIENSEIINIPYSRYLSDKFFKFSIKNNDLSDKLLTKILNSSKRLGTISDICIGIQLGGGEGKQTKLDFISDTKKDDNWKKVLDGKDINSYSTKWKNLYVNYGNWLHRKRDEKFFLTEKVIIRQIGNIPVATLDKENFYTLNTIYNLIPTSQYSAMFILAIINCKLGKWFWVENNSDYKTLFPKIKKTEIQSIPIPIIDFKNKNDAKNYNEIIAHIDNILLLYKDIQVTNLESKKEQIKNKVEYSEERINELVYQLYDLTEEDIKIIENGK